MTAPTIAESQREAVAAARPGSRAARLSIPRTIDVLKELAVEYGVCVRPQPFRYIDPETGRATIVDLSCKATRTSMCPSCAAKSKQTRQVQCREGWHRITEPITPEPATEEQRALVIRRADLEFLAARAEYLGEWETASLLHAEMAALEEQITLSGLRGLARTAKKTPGDGGDRKRRRRSTRRRQDVPNLPRKKIQARTVGELYVGRDGREHRPSTSMTVTLRSYGRVRRSDSMPVDFTTYDYQTAALDAVHFPALLDRFWQNLRRAVGWNVQYFGCVEPQKRLAPHAHFAARGTFPRATFKAVVAGTYHNVWQPSTDVVVFPEDGPQPEWLDAEDNGGVAGYWSPWTGQLLPSWDEAMDALDAQIEAGQVGPAHVMRFGEQAHEDIFDDTDEVNADRGDGQASEDGEGGWVAEGRTGMRGIEPGTAKAEKAIRYLTKYITKSVDECHQRTTAREIEHHHRFYEALRFTPCSDGCANWLRYGIQPKDARPGMVAGRCRKRVHQPATLGIGGRRILVSRDWSGKTLADHRADQATWVRQILAIGLDHTEPHRKFDNHGEDQGDELHAGVDEGEGSHGWPDLADECQRDENGQLVLTIDGERDDQDEATEPGDQQPASVVRQPQWERLNPSDRAVKPLHVRLWRLVGERIRRRTEWQTKLAQLNATMTGPPGGGGVSATAAAQGDREA